MPCVETAISARYTLVGFEVATTDAFQPKEHNRVIVF